MTLGYSTGYKSAVLAGDLAAIPLNFPVYSSGDLEVVIRESVGDALVKIAVLNTDFTVSGVGEGAGATVTPLSATLFASGRKAHIYRTTPPRQDDSLRELAKFPGLSVELGQDRQAAMIQDVARKVADLSGRALIFPFGTAGQELPAAEAGKALIWSDSGALVNGLLASVGEIAINAGWAGKLTEAPTKLLTDYTGAITPLEHEAVGDGVADDAPAVRAAAAAAQAQGRMLLFPKGYTFRLGTGSGVTVDGGEIVVDVTGLTVVIDGVVVCDYDDANNIIFHAGGSQGSTVLLGANASELDTTITTATSDAAAPGDIVKIWSDDTFEVDTSSKRGEFSTVSSVSGTTVALRGVLHDDYATADAAAMAVMDMARCVIKGDGVVRGFGRTPVDKLQVGVAFFKCIDPVVDGDLTFEEINTHVIWPRDCFGGRIRGGLIRNVESTGEGYGLAPDGASQDIEFSGWRIDNVGHACTTVNSSAVPGIQRRIVFRDIRATYSAPRGASFDQPTEPFDTHAGCEDIEFLNCTAESPFGSGFNFQGASGKILSCKVYYPYGDGILVRNTTKKLGRIEVSDNLVVEPRNSGRGVYLFHQSGHAGYASAKVCRNKIVNPPGIGIHVQGFTGGARSSGLEVNDNEVIEAAGTNAYYLDWWLDAQINDNKASVAGATTNGMRIRDIVGGSVAQNHIDMGPSNAIAIYLNSSTAASLTRLAVVGNTGEGGSSASGIFADANATQCTFAGNEFTWSGFATPLTVPTGKSHRDIDRLIDAGLPLLTGKRQFSFAPGVMIANTTAGAALASTETGTNKMMEQAYYFDDTTRENVQFSMPAPKGWNEGTITAQFIWRTASSSGSVRWGLRGAALSDGEGLDVAWGAASEVTDAAGTAGVVFQTAEIGPVTLGNSPAEGDFLIFQAYRDPTHGDDNMAGDARLMGVRIFLTLTGQNDA